MAELEGTYSLYLIEMTVEMSCFTGGLWRVQFAK